MTTKSASSRPCPTASHTDNITPETLLDSEITNAYGELVQLRDLVDLEYGQGMTQIDHLERNRNIRLQVTPPDNVALQTAMELISEDLVPKMHQQGGLEGVRISTGGNAHKLTETRLALQWNFVLAVVITYLLMSALFSSYIYPPSSFSRSRWQQPGALSGWR